jgi:hypothetical protein
MTDNGSVRPAPATPAGWPEPGTAGAVPSLGPPAGPPAGPPLGPPAGPVPGFGVGAGPPEPRQRPSRLMLWTVVGAAVLAVLCVGAAVVGVIAGVRSYNRSHEQATAAIGQPARDGQFMFTADKVTCGLKQVGPPDDYLTPTGEFCVVELNVRNVGTGPAIFADALQEAYAPNGNRYATDSAAGLYANPDPTIFFNDINPGIDVKALVVYDIPTGGGIARLELHESPGSRGVMIKVR